MTPRRRKRPDMDVTPLVKEGAQIIQSYRGGAFRVSGQVYDGAVIVSPQETIVWDVRGTVDALQQGDFDVLTDKADGIDVVLLGSGAALQFIDPALKAGLKAKGLSVDVMDTGAASRTYNVLMAEGRRVVAALLPV
ncbi:MAG: Mth938-like domain-containing protein [Bdellovibrionales bacterium]